MRVTILILLYIICFSFHSLSQWNGIKESFLKQDSLIINEPFEKIFAHFDKYYYQPDDTLRLSGYVINSFNGGLSDSSKIVYLDVINNSGKTVKRLSTSNISGKFNLKLFLKDKQFPPGQYFVGIYTQHLLNYTNPVPFLYHFIVSNTELYSNWKIDISDYAFNGSGILLTGKISAPKKLLLQQFVKMRIYTDKNDTINISPERDGSFIAELPFGKNTSGINIEIEHEGKYEAPLRISTANMKSLKLDFFPEGGVLIYDRPQIIGIKVIGTMEKGVPAKGTVVDETNQIIMNFHTDENGIGIINLTPRKGKTYKAIINAGLSFDLPQVKESSVCLNIKNDKVSDSIEIIVAGTADLYNSKYFLRASSQGVSIVMGAFHLSDSFFSMKIAKNIIPRGICHFALYDQSNQIINERNIFVENKFFLKINVIRNESISPDSLQLIVKTTVENAQPIPSLCNISVSIVNANSLPPYVDATNIASYYYLLSELDNTTEQYSQYNSLNFFTNLDNLLLTQKYIGPHYIYADNQYPYEEHYIVSGKILNVINKPIENAKISLLSYEGKKFSFLLQTKSTKDGNFRFDSFPTFLTDSVKFLFTVNKKGNNLFSTSIAIDEMKTPHYTVNPFVINTRFLNYKAVAANSINEQSKNKLLTIKKSKELLPEVIVKGKIKIAGSKNLNSDGGADITIGTAALQELSKESLLQVLYKTIPKFYKGKLGQYLYAYKINNSYIVFTIDGYNINKYYDPVSESNLAFTEYCDSYLNYLKAEDVKGIEVMISNKYTFEYEKYFGYATTIDISYVFIEITTFSGNGAFYKHSSNSLQYKPLAPVVYSSSYSPTSDEIALSYLKSPSGLKIIYWNADLSTSDQGVAGFSFIKPDNENDYIVVVQGIDQQGRLGYYFEYLNDIVSKPN